MTSSCVGAQHSAAVDKGSDVVGRARTVSARMVELRAGTNGWLCVADDSPAAPGDSPACFDRVWQKWFAAYAHLMIPVAAH